MPIVLVLVVENGLSAPIASEAILAHVLGHFARKGPTRAQYRGRVRLRGPWHTLPSS
jgi:hypothetical protein